MENQQKKKTRGMRVQDPIQDLSKIRENQSRHLSDNRPVTQKEINQLNSNFESQLDDFNTSIIGLKTALEDNKINTDIRSLIAAYNRKDEEVMDALNEVKELMQPMRGMSLSQAQRAGIEVGNWQHMQRLKQDYALTIPNEVIQMKVKEGLLPANAGDGSQERLFELLAILRNEGVDVSGFKRENMSMFRALLLLNDWRSIAQKLGQEAFRYFGNHLPMKDIGEAVKIASPQIYGLLQTVARELPKYVDTGADSGLWIGDSSSAFNEMDKRYVHEGTNQFNSSVPRNIVGSNRYDSVDFQYLACYICPERFQFREPISFPMQTAIVHSTYHYPVDTNANGDALIYINPDGPTYESGEIASTSVATPSTQQSHDKFFILDVTGRVQSTSDMVTGKFEAVSVDSTNIVASKNELFEAGPLFPVKNQILKFKVIGFSVTYKNQSSDLQSSGAMHFGYFPLSGIEAVNNGQSTASSVAKGYAVGINAIDNSPYKQNGNLKVAYRFNHIPNPDLFPKSQEERSKLEDLYVVAITGAQSSDTIGTLEISYVYEYQPQLKTQLMSDRQESAMGSYTNEFIANAIKQFPALMTMTYEDSYKLASRIYQNKLTSAADVQKLLEDYFNRNH